MFVRMMRVIVWSITGAGGVLSAGHALATGVAATQQSNGSDASLSEADSAFASHDFERAIRLYESMVAGHTKVARAYLNLAILYDQSRKGGGYTERAGMHYRRAIELDPKDADSHFHWALHLYSQGRSDDALAALQAAAELNANHAEARYWLARLLRGRGGKAATQCESLLKEVIRLDRGYVDAYFDLGRLLSNQGRKKEAASILTEGKSLPPREGHHDCADFADALSELEN